MFDFSKISGWDELSARQKEFCLAFLRCGNGAAAARSAGYATKSADAQASKLKNNPLVRSCIAELRNQQFAAESVSQEEAEAILSRIARSQIGGVLSSGGSVNLDADQGGVASVSMAESAKGCSVSVKMRDPVSAISLLSKLKGWGVKEEAAAVQVGGVTFTFDFKRGGGNAN